MKLKERVVAATFGFGFALVIVLIFESQQLMISRLPESTISKMTYFSF
jgi:hypothetical protein